MLKGVFVGKDTEQAVMGTKQGSTETENNRGVRVTCLFYFFAGLPKNTPLSRMAFASRHTGMTPKVQAGLTAKYAKPFEPIAISRSCLVKTVGDSCL